MTITPQPNKYQVLASRSVIRPGRLPSYNVGFEIEDGACTLLEEPSRVAIEPKADP